jgi:putative SOS response-associated peptidase YedK
MEEIRLKTMNARGETITTKPAFRHAALQKHCLVLADGFFEWREYNQRKYPYYLRLHSQEPFAFAGLWDTWTNKKTQDVLSTFTIITTQASPLLAKIHNTKKRMPVLLPKNKEHDWLTTSTSSDDLADLLQPVDDAQLEAYPISRVLTSRTQDSNTPEVIRPYAYPELPPLKDQTTLF